MRPALALLLFLAVACGKSEARKETVIPGNVQRGKELIAQNGCNVCHIIPGIEGMQGSLGPDLTGIASRAAISEGKVQNTPANLARFIENPQSLNPQSAMPPARIPPADGQHIAAYLFTLR